MQRQTKMTFVNLAFLIRTILRGANEAIKLILDGLKASEVVRLDCSV